MEDLEAWRFGDGYQGESYRWKNLRLGGLESCQGESYMQELEVLRFGDFVGGRIF